MSATILILFGAVIFTILAFIIIMLLLLNRKRFLKREEQELQNLFQQEFLKTQLETQEQTFHQIGEELHDNIGQLLSSTRMLMGITERALPEVPDTFRTADETLAKAIQDLRIISKSLNKEWLNQFNIVDNLGSEVHRINAAKTIVAELQSSQKTLPLNPESQVMLFRVIQEALHNSIKHSEAKHISITLQVQEMIKVTVTDDGKGFELNEQNQAGVGIMNMRHRTRLLGGTISWKPLPGHGTEIIIIIPIQRENYEN